MHLTEDQPIPRKTPQGDSLDLSKLREELEIGLPQWSADGSASPKAESTESRLARIELKDAIESLIDPQFRFNIAGRDFVAAVEKSKEMETDVVALVGDVSRLFIRSINERIDRVLRHKHLRILWARVWRRRNVVEALRKDVPFMVREVVLVRPDGSVASSAKRLTGDAKLSEILESGGNGKDGESGKKSRRAEKKDATRTFSKLARIADANTTADRNIVFATGSRFAVAASVQGIVPRRLRSRLALTVKTIEEDVDDGGTGTRLTAAKSRRAKRYLTEILELTRYKLEEPMPWLQAFAFAAIAGAAFLFAAAAFSSWKETRWQELIAEIESIPGIDVTSSSNESRPRLIVGFRDPLAADPLPLIGKSGFESNDVAVSFFPHRSSDAPIVEKRVVSVLEPPDTVTLRLANGVMFVTGSAPHAWLNHCERQRSFLLPQTQLDLSGVVDESLAACRAAAETLLPERLVFDSVRKTTVILREGDLARITDRIRALQQKALEAGIPLEIRIVGRHCDPASSFAIENLRTGRERADHVRDLILASEPAIDSLVLRALGERPLPDSAFDAAKRNQAVEFVVTLDGEKLAPEAPIQNASQANSR